MRGKHKGTKPSSSYYDKRGTNGRREGEEFTYNPQFKSNPRGGRGGHPKRGGYDSRDKEYGYKYISKDKKIYDIQELYDLFDKAHIDEIA